MADGNLLEIYYDRVVNGETITYRHIAPPCSNYKVNYADVDKEGSGRNSLTGEMFRERIGNYRSIDLTWNLIPNTKEYNNWYKVLTHLPTSFHCKSLMPTGEIEDREFYRTDVSTTLYLFVKDSQIWQGLSTTFVQYNLDEYDDNFEPELEEI